MTYCKLNECSCPEESGICAECPDNYGRFDDDGVEIENWEEYGNECDYIMRYGD